MQSLGSQVRVIRALDLVSSSFFLVDAFMLGEVDFDKMTDVFKASPSFHQFKSLNDIPWTY